MPWENPCFPAVMVSGPRNEFEFIRTALEALGRPFYVGEQPGSAPTMKLANNMLAPLKKWRLGEEVAPIRPSGIRIVDRFVGHFGVCRPVHRRQPNGARIHDRLAERNIAAIDSPVSGGVGGAE
jgi:3-hydroxyisobutyrate dehydrogenase-like beta-hydroxyacid dehydrogenase